MPEAFFTKLQCKFLYLYITDILFFGFSPQGS